MSQLPCKNPNCKSYGVPHLNCKCYGGMAAGGVVPNFCGTSRAHEPTCQYFEDGGEVINPDDVTIDPTPAPTAPAGLPEDIQVGATIPPDAVVLDDIDPDAVTVDAEKPRPPGGDDSWLAALEGGVKGFFSSPVGEAIMRTAPVIVGSELMTPEARKARELAHPEAYQGAAVATLVGSLLTGTGELGAIGKVAEGAAKLADAGKIGSGIIKGAISGGLFQGADEVGKWMLGEGDPTHPVGAALAHTGGTALLTGALGGIAGTGGVMLEKMAASRVGGKLQSFLAGFGAAARHAPEAESSPGLRERDLVDLAIKDFFESPEAPSGASLKAYEMGKKAFDAGFRGVPKSLAQAAGGAAGHHLGSDYAGYKIGEALYAPLSNLVEKIARPAARKIVAPVTLKILSSGNTEGLIEALKFAEQAAAGEAAATKGVSAMMLGSPGSFGAVTRKGVRDKLEKWIDEGGVGQEIQQEVYNQAAPMAAEPFAKGGDVKPVMPPQNEGPGIHRNKGLELHYPEQSVLLSAARGRISNYLTGLKPHDSPPARPFDDAPDLREKKRAYHRALDLAAAPLSILDEIGKGTLESDQVRHFNALHPELGGLLKKKIAESIARAQVDGKKPPYRVRQALSMFMGTDLSSEMNPSNIQAAQQVFALKAPKPEGRTQASSPSSGDKKALSKSDEAFLTGNQAREKRMGRVG